MRILYLPNEYSQQRQHEKKRKIYPVLMAMEAEWYRKQGHEVWWGEMGLDVGFTKSSVVVHKIRPDRTIYEPEGLPFLSLPHPDRNFTRWWEYQDNGNFKYHPGTYIMSALGCWHGKCSFCVENGKPYEIRPVDDVIDEIIECDLLGFREIFDDSATFPTGEWLEDFCELMEVYHYASGIKISCNMRLFPQVDYKMMKQSGFRMVLFGIESANQYTLDKINKGVKVEDIIPTIKKASECGLEPHIAVMFGYPWETDEDAIRTLKLVHYLLRKGYAKTAQASYFRQGNLESNRGHRKYIRQIYHAAFYPDFWFNKIKDVRNVEDLKYIWKGIKSWLAS